MEKFKAGLINAGFFIAGDLTYSLVDIGHKNDSVIYFGTVLVLLLFFVLHKLDVLIEGKSGVKKAVSQQKKYTNWILCLILGSGFAFTSNGSTLLRWIS
ncbi:MAG: hypothetical protein HYX48_07450 [Chlamydiales bacterium]|nr:hypothetical protein [Chlamydiales bacterium]